MPQDLWHLERGDLTLKRPLMTSDIHALRKYASRVRVLKHEEHAGRLVGVHTSIYQALLLSSNDCLLPRLEELWWAPKGDVNMFYFIRLFLGPRLKVLDLTFGLDKIRQLGLLDIISTIFSPHISELHVRNLCPSVAGFTPSALPAWTRLKSLYMEDITLDDLVYIAKLPALECLTFSKLSSLWTLQASKPGTETQLLRSLRAVEQPFSTLKVLAMNVYAHIEEAVKLLKLFRDTKLARLNVVYEYLGDRPDTVNGLDEFIETVARSCRVDFLRTFTLLHCVRDVTFLAAFRPLLNFHVLENVDIYGVFPLKLTDEDVAEIASSWPNIRTLRLPFHLPGCSLPSLLVLLAFAKCTKLRHLSLIIDASDKVARQVLRKDTAKARTRNYSLKILSVGWSPISHKEFIASFLSDVFPNLEDIHSEVVVNRGNERDHHRWQYIGQILLPMFGRIRGREYERMGVRVTNHSPEKGSARWYSDGVEDGDGDWSDAEELLDRSGLTTDGDSYKARGFK
ncbi:hypothetical protein P691DRAFT_805543 [Macrolepiota fuliginosa MF-IS2]|uniref:F-box domain-containing protein n=1 Tax=Macrolepiota fuliginosa MF-IS2 TaxID=1400762 RepID=A0A9P5X911_9AGAR|nr:hypothetical protein P691DRAFT_805543 [Macrolepiota fuliginosa MF-IS2]